MHEYKVRKISEIVHVQLDTPDTLIIYNMQLKHAHKSSIILHTYLAFNSRKYLT